MSSIASAPKRTTDQQPKNGKQQLLEMLSDPEAPKQDDQQEEPATTGRTQSIDEIDPVERLLSQLEARSLALVPYGYGNLREVPARKSNSGTVLLAGTLVAIWLSTLILGLAYIRYVSHPSSRERASGTQPLLIAAEPDPQQQKVATSVDRLAQALVSSSERMNQLQAAMDRSNRDLQRIASKVNSDHGRSFSVASRSKTIREERSVSLPPETAPVTTNLPRNWHRVIEVKPSDSAVAHKTSDGTIDYWLVPRGPDQAPNKVLAIGTSTEGVVVHNLEDGKDYTLTPSGEWRTGASTTRGN